ncbi:MAG TPA: glycosyltransferase family 39 protein [Longimicrobiales bacterium]|nr:glycosyltransferase family 39 protein [Longimicrobiales bacterium]
MSHATIPTAGGDPGAAPGRGPDLAALARWLPVAVWVLAMLHALVWLDRGWFPHDLGSVAHPAQRVLLGELPHRDFDDVYTGGLAFLNALGFRIMGESAMSARWVLLAAYAAWVPAVWALARRFARPWLAAAATLLAASWTLPVYAEAMPSWYNLFLGTASLWALVRFADGGGRRWLFWAGAAAGGSILFKVIGLYTVAAGLLGLAWLEDAGRPHAVGGAGRRADALYRWFLAAGSLALVALVAGLVARAMGAAGLLRFGVPALAAPLVLAWAARRATGVASRDRFAELLRTAAPFALGVAAALAPFLVLYAAVGALDDLYRGVFVLPRRRLADAAWPGLRGVVVGIALSAAALAAVVLAPRVRARTGKLLAAAAAVAGVAALALSGMPRVYLAVWEGLWWLPPFVAAAGAVALVRSGRAGAGAGAGMHQDPGGWANTVYLALAAYGLASLVEIPFAAPVYFFFAAPLMVLVALALAGARPRPSRPAWLGGLVCLLLAFTLLRLAPGFVRHLGLQPARHDQTETLRIPRGGGLRVDAAARDEIEEVVAMVDALASGPFVYATPDAPEIYVLTGRRNPTRTLFEFLDPEPETRVARTLEALDRSGVRVAVINRRPFFSGPVSPELVAGLQARYPMAREVGRFLVVWSDPP